MTILSPTEAPSVQESSNRLLWNRQFLLLMAVTFLVYANTSVFFQFYQHLSTLPIDPGSFGLLIGIFSSVSLVLRPFVSSFLHPANAYRWLYTGAILVIGSLLCYSVVQGFWSMLLVRLLHGFSFVLLGAALLTIIVEFIPKGRSAQFFGLMTIVTILPNTVIPPILPALDRSFGGFTNMLIGFGLVTVLVFPMIKAAGAPVTGVARPDAVRLTGKEIAANLADRRIVLTLIAMLCLYSAYALVFFYLDGYGKSLGIAATGLFMTLATAGEIGIRLFAGSIFDRFNKALISIGVMLFLAGGYALLACVHGNLFFYAAGALLGLGWGVGMPVFNGILFDLSGPKYRAFNANLGMQVFQGGFFLGPLLFGPVVAPWGFRSLFWIGAGLSVAGAAIVMFNRKDSQ